MNAKLEHLTAKKLSYPVPDIYEAALEKIEKQMSEILRFAEKHCRKIRKIDGYYNLPAKY